MDVHLDITPELVDYLAAIARAGAICDEFPLAYHVRARLKAHADLRWVQPVARREGLPLAAREVPQALEAKRPPPRHKDAVVIVQRLGELHADVRRLGQRVAGVGPGLLERFHRTLDRAHPSGNRYRGAPRKVYFLAGVPEHVPREDIPRAVEEIFTWLSDSPLGRSPVLGVAVAHQEMMLLTPFLDFSPAVVDAATRCQLMQRGVDRHGMSVLEQQFASDMNEYGFVLQDRSDAGRARWVRYFVSRLAAALRVAAKEVFDLRRHLEREPWLDAAPLTEREQLAYGHILAERKATSRQVERALGRKASTLRMVQRDLARLAELGFIEKVGGRKDAFYRPLGNLDNEGT